MAFLPKGRVSQKVKKSICQKVILSFLRVFLLQRGSGIINSEHSVCSVFGNNNKKIGVRREMSTDFAVVWVG